MPAFSQCSQSSSSSTVVARWRGDLSVVHPLQAKGGNKKKAGGRKGQKKGGSSSDDYDSDGYDDDYSQAVRYEGGLRLPGGLFVVEAITVGSTPSMSHTALGTSSDSTTG